MDELISGLNKRVFPCDQAAAEKARARWNSIAKPLGSLGFLEDAIVKIAGLTGNDKITLANKTVLVFCADNGVVEEGVTQTGSEITALMAENIAKGRSSVCKMAEAAGANVIAVDVGMKEKPASEGILNLRAAAGTANIAKGPAMTKEQCERAVLAGVEMAARCKKDGVNLIACGEMGIGNTTTSAALASVFLSIPPDKAAGRGAGLSDAGLTKKIGAIERAIAVNRPDPKDAFEVLRHLGGFDIAAMAGACIGGAIYRIPVMLDGFISAVAAMIAVRMFPTCEIALLASHVSAEPAAGLVLNALGLKPLIAANMRLGEGTGAVCAFPLLDMANAVYSNMATFGEIGMDNYTPQGNGI